MKQVAALTEQIVEIADHVAKVKQEALALFRKHLLASAKECIFAQFPELHWIGFRYAISHHCFSGNISVRFQGDDCSLQRGEVEMAIEQWLQDCDVTPEMLAEVAWRNGGTSERDAFIYRSDTERISK